MILVFGDTHIGYKFYGDSFNSKTGLVASEESAFRVFEEVYEIAQQPDIDLIIHTGDVFHSATPTTKNIHRLINILHKFSSLDKPFIMITGNHDVSYYSHSFIYLHSVALDLKNIRIIDSLDNSTNTLQYYDWSIVFVPYVLSNDLLDKDSLVRNSVESLLSNPLSEKQIIVSHLQEASCRKGTEGQLISHSVPVIDINRYEKNATTLLLLGHIHTPQIYSNSSITTVYPGSAIPIDFSDVNNPRGYVLVDKSGMCTQKKFTTVRNFKTIIIPDNISDIYAYIQQLRLYPNDVYFILVKDYHVVDRNTVKEILRSKNATLGDVRIASSEEITLLHDINTNTGIQTFVNPADILHNYIDQIDMVTYGLEQSSKNTLLSLGLNILQEVR